MVLLSQETPSGGLDASTEFNTITYPMVYSSYMGLTSFPPSTGSAGLKVVPGLATQLPTPSDDGRVWTAHLRSGVRFSNGAPLTPAAVKYSVLRTFKLAGGSSYYMSSVIGYTTCTAHPNQCAAALNKGITVDSAANTVTFHLTAANGFFPTELTQLLIVPTNTPMKQLPFTPSVGPYKFTQSNNNETVLVRNPYYNNFNTTVWPEANPNSIVMKYGLTPSAELNEIADGEADWMFDTPPAGQINSLAAKYPSQVHVTPYPQLMYLDFNVKVPPFTSLDVRQAVSYALDRNALVTTAGGPRFASPSCNMLPPELPGYVNYCPYTSGATASGINNWSGADMAKAKQLVAASGQAGKSVVVLTDPSPVYSEAAAVVVQTLNSLGFKASSKTMSETAMFNEENNSTYKFQAGINQWLAFYAGSFLGFNLCNSFYPNSDANSNDAEICDPAFDKTLNEAYATAATNMPKALQLIGQADKLLTNQAPQATLYANNFVAFVSSRLRNYVYGPYLTFLPFLASVTGK